MSRRPRTVHEQRVARALRTMAPGGRLASESPVHRPRFTGGAPSTGTPMTLLTYDQSYELDEGESTFTITAGTLTAGQVLVGWAQSYDLGGITPPSGWTTVLSGAVTNLEYCLAYRQIAGGDSLTWSFGSVGGLGRMSLWKFDNDGTARTLNANAATEATATTVALDDSPNGAWIRPWNMWAAAPSDQVDGANYDYPSSQMAVDLTTYAPSGALNAGFGLNTAPTPDECKVVTYTIAAFDKPDYTTPQTCEWVTVCAGWT